MLQTPFYDPNKSYDDNYEQGPFGIFADNSIYENKGEPKYTFHGQPVYLPFGIPAGPILNSRFAKGAFEKGFDIVVYKTVRSSFYPCHPYPNILAVKVDGDLTIQATEKPLLADQEYREPLSITNSFGVPSKEATVWQEDVKKAIGYARKGQVLVLSFMGTVRPGQTQQEFIDDNILAAKLAYETGAKVLEVNLSCPNIGNEGLVCYNLAVTRRICEGIRKVIRNTPLIVKVGYYQDDASLKELAEIVNEYANGIAAINTIQAEIRDSAGDQALPGPMRLRSGVCGESIRWAGLEMVERLKKIREEKNYHYTIEGVGGVMKAADYKKYRAKGADTVMSATGAMWNPLLAQQIKKHEDVEDEKN